MGETIKLVLTVIILLLILGIVVVELIVNITAFKAIKEFFSFAKDVESKGGTCGIAGCQLQECYRNGVKINCSEILEIANLTE